MYTAHSALQCILYILTLTLAGVGIQGGTAIHPSIHRWRLAVGDLRQVKCANFQMGDENFQIGG